VSNDLPNHFTCVFPISSKDAAIPVRMVGQAGLMRGRDVGAWEVQGNCTGHLEKAGEYRYHTLSSYISDTARGR